MTRRLVVRPQAELDIAEIIDWYDSKRLGLGTKFFASFTSVLTRVLTNPAQYQVVDSQIRAVRIKSFPYKVLYASTDEEVAVIGCFHAHRDPNTWRTRLD